MSNLVVLVWTSSSLLFLDLRNIGFFQETSSSQQQIEVFATKSKVKMPSRPWMGVRPSTSPSEPKQQKLVVVRGRVQTKASVESEDGQRDAEALVALNVPEKAVFIERTQTVRTISYFGFNFPSTLFGVMLISVFR